MKQLLFLFFMQLNFSSTFSQIGNTVFGFVTNPKEVIKANSIIREEVYSYNFNSRGIKDSSLTRTYYYNNLADLVEERLAKSDNYKESITTYEYSYYPSGKLRRQVVDNKGLRMITIYEYEYDELGNEIVKYEYNKDTTRLIIEQKVFNEKGQVVQLLTKIDNYEFYVSRKYYYNPDNDLSKMEAFDFNGKLSYTDIFQYDSARKSKTVYLENEEGRKLVGEYFYNNDRQCVRTTSNAFDNSSKRTENVYNSDKTIFESSVYLDDKKVQMNRHYYFRQ